MDISEWLRGLDLAQYGPIFRENAIDAGILPELTEADLEKLGVVLGHRKRMLRAIAVLEAPALQPPTTTASEAERRQLTVMFCDLVGSTPLSTRSIPRICTRSCPRSLRHRHRRPLWRFCRQVYGRWRADLFLLSGGA